MHLTIASFLNLHSAIYGVPSIAQIATIHFHLNISIDILIHLPQIVNRIRTFFSSLYFAFLYSLIINKGEPFQLPRFLFYLSSMVGGTGR